MNWSDFIDEAPDRIAEVIEDGPKPLAEFGADGSVGYKSRVFGLARQKFGTDRKAVIYFDPNFCFPEVSPDDVPDSILDQHSEENIDTVASRL